MRLPRHHLALFLAIIPLSAVLFACGVSNTVSTVAKTPTVTFTRCPAPV